MIEALLFTQNTEGVTLTAKKEIGVEVKRRHDIVKRFLEFLQVRRDIAIRGACIMEYDLGKETIEQL